MHHSGGNLQKYLQSDMTTLLYPPTWLFVLGGGGREAPADASRAFFSYPIAAMEPPDPNQNHG